MYIFIEKPSKDPQPTTGFHRKTYAETLNVIPPSVPSTAPPKPITIHPCPDLTTKLSHTLIGELFTIDTIPNLHSICEDNGLPNTRITYVGGFHVLIELEGNTSFETVLNKTSFTSCFKTLKPWDDKFHLKNRLAWISIEGLPPQAWHEAAFSCIAGDLGEIVVPEKCNPSCNNLVAGKVCIRTKCMDVILHTLPVIIDNMHICIRIRELIGEYNNILPDKTTTHSDDEDDELYDDGSEFELFQGDPEDEGDENFHGEGGWVKDDDKNCNSSPMSSEFSGIQQLLTEIEHMQERSSSENLNSPDMCRSQREPTASPHNENVDNKLSSHIVPETQMENNTKDAHLSPLEDVSDKDVDKSLYSAGQPSRDNRYVPIPKVVNLVDLEPTFPINFHEPSTQNTSPNLDLPVGPLYKPNIQNLTDPINTHFKPNEPCKVYARTKQHKKKLHSSAPPPIVTTKKQTNFNSLKLIDSINGIHPRVRKAKNPKPSGSNSKPNTPSVSYPCNDSSIVRCNNRIINSEPTHSSESVNEVSKTIEVGSILGYNLAGREVDVSNIINNTGDNIVNP